MTHKILLLLNLVLISGISMAQYVEVQANYNSVGDCIFDAYNNTKVPMYLHINFSDLENTTFNEPLPFVKKVEPGFNSLFTLQHDHDYEILRFNYDIETFRSNPTADVDLDFPYLIPLKEGESISVFDVKSIDGFLGNDTPDSWFATGFMAGQGDAVFASRNGIVAELIGESRTEDSSLWYHAYTNSITLLQPDGTLICYHGVQYNSEQLVVGQKVYAGQKIGEIANKNGELVVLIFNDSLFNKNLSFVIPQFVVDKNGNAKILTVVKPYIVSHPNAIRGQEMTNREKRKLLKYR